MSTWSGKRQLTYLLIPLTIVLLFGVFVYFKYFHTAPSCTDGVQDGTETGIDCGGTCSLICSNDSISPVVLWAKSFQVVGNIWNAVAYVQNPNAASIAHNVSYEFDLYDANNMLIVSRQGVTDIPPGKTFPIFEASINTQGKTVKRTDFTFSPVIKGVPASPIVWTKDTATDPELIVVHQALTGTSTSPKLMGTITNPNLTTVGPIQLTALIFDGRQNAIGASKTVVDPLAPGVSTPFVFTWPQPFPTGAVACELPADVMLVIDRSGSMASLNSGLNFSTTTPQPLTDVKATAENFLSDLQTGDTAGVVSFGTTPSNPIDQPLSADFTLAKAALQNVSISTSTYDRDTDIGDALNSAGQALLASPNTHTKKVIVLLTDGVPNEPTSTVTNYPTVYAESVASTQRAHGIDIFTIGLGQDVNTDILTNIAGSQSQFFSAPTTAVLATIYNTIAQSICIQKPLVIEIISQVLNQ